MLPSPPMDFQGQGTLGFKRHSKLFCYLISGGSRKIQIREFPSFSAFSATLEVFLCSLFANTTDCVPPSHINIWWCRTLAMITKDSGIHRHPSRPTSQAYVPGAHCKLSGSWLFISRPQVLCLLSPGQGVSGLGKVG